MKTVDELVADWSEDERELLKDLIDECREREKRVIENSRRSRENLIDLNHSLTSFLSNLCEIRKEANGIEDAFLGIYLRLYKKRMPAA